MSEITLQLPETLHNQFDLLARQEGVSLNQYVLYALTRQVTDGYVIQRLTPDEVAKQAMDFAARRARWGAATSDKTVDQILAEREIAEPEPDLTPDLVAKLRARIAAAQQQKQAKAVGQELG